MNIIRRFFSSQHWKLQESAIDGTVYVHWPYCSQLCTYCNFNKYVRSDVDHARMTTCLVKELISLIKLSGIKKISSVYFGGGTPSLANPSTVEAILNTVSKHSDLNCDAEVTLEANPTSVQTETLRTFKMAGVTRLSVGVQSFVDSDLKLMNRDHSVAEAERCLLEAHQLFPGQFSVDLIFGRPHQTLCGWTKELKQLQSIFSSHVSLYQLTVEQGTPLARAVKKNEIEMPSTDLVADMYETAIEMLSEVGLNRYEISNFASVGCESRHNLSYWRGCNYLGIGPGAHSRFYQDGQFTHSVNTPEPNSWMTKVTTKGHGMQKVQLMDPYERLEEVVATSMRTTEGLTIKVWNKFSPSLQLHEIFYDHPLITGELITLDEHGMQATNRGLIMLDSILPELILYLNRLRTTS